MLERDVCVHVSVCGGDTANALFSPSLAVEARFESAIRTAAAASNESHLDAEELVQTGAVVSAHGLRGEVRVMPFTDFVEERFFSPNTQYGGRGAGPWRGWGIQQSPGFRFPRLGSSNRA